MSARALEDLLWKTPKVTGSTFCNRAIFSTQRLVPGEGVNKRIDSTPKYRQRKSKIDKKRGYGDKQMVCNLRHWVVIRGSISNGTNMKVFAVAIVSAFCVFTTKLYAQCYEQPSLNSDGSAALVEEVVLNAGVFPLDEIWMFEHEPKNYRAENSLC